MEKSKRFDGFERIINAAQTELKSVIVKEEANPFVKADTGISAKDLKLLTADATASFEREINDIVGFVKEEFAIQVKKALAGATDELVRQINEPEVRERALTRIKTQSGN